MYESSGIIEEVKDDKLLKNVYYMPHRGVVKESSETTPVRPVFNASAPGYNGLSLNDCLLTGPSLTPALVENLLRFRRWPVAVTGDITKAFLQIGVKEKDRDVHRFLLKDETGRVRHMRFTRVPMGNTASPFLLNATIKFHLNKYPETELIKELKEDIYVDNWLSGGNSSEEACNKFEEAKAILDEASMPLAKVESNVMEIKAKFN